MVVMVVRAAFAILAIFFNALPEMPMVATMEDKTPWKMKTETFSSGTSDFEHTSILFQMISMAT